jgi:ribonuclease-3
MPPESPSDSTAHPPDARADAAELAASTLGHRFADHGLLDLACTHGSSIDSQLPEAERRRLSNERLEFLGDAVLGAAVPDLLVARCPQASEGELSRYKSRLVSRRTLAQALRGHPLVAICRVGEMPEPWPDSILANLAEAFLGAIFQDGGWAPTTQAVQRLIGPLFEEALSAGATGDVKSRLQSWSLKRTQSLPVYETVRAGGSDHEPHFTSRVSAGGLSASGSAGSRRNAEAAAAAELLQVIARCQPPGA